MDTHAPEFLYIAFILPALFALTFLGEGVYKMTRHEDGFFLALMGVAFLIIITFAYFFLFK